MRCSVSQTAFLCFLIFSSFRPLQAARPYLGEAGREVQGLRGHHHRQDGLNRQRT